MNKLMKKIIATLAGGLLAVTPLAVTPFISLAATKSTQNVTWSHDVYINNYTDWRTELWGTTQVNINGQGEIPAAGDITGWFEDYDEAIKYYKAVGIADESDYAKQNTYHLHFEYGCNFEAEDADFEEEALDEDLLQCDPEEVLFQKNDTIEVQLPVSGNALLVDNYAGDWDVKLVGNNKLVLKCLKPTDHAIINAFLVKKPKELKDGFWFESMKTQLNIAAEMAKKSGKEVTAQTEGDFALSYEIMDFLKKNPNVTMNYKLSYKEVVYDLVISGKKVNPDISIPWYGPEYLIGNFYKK